MLSVPLLVQNLSLLVRIRRGFEQEESERTKEEQPGELIRRPL